MNPLWEAAKNLKGHWHQGSYFSDDGINACGLGHLSKAVGGHQGNVIPEGVHDLLEDCSDLMIKVAAEQYPERIKAEGMGFGVFNDHKDTTEDDVIAVMEKAAVRFDEKI